MPTGNQEKDGRAGLVHREFWFSSSFCLSPAVWIKKLLKAPFFPRARTEM